MPAPNILDRIVGSPAQMAARPAALRTRMAELAVDWLAAPHDDAWFNEYLPDCAQRLAWLTGFTGSARLVWVGRERAALFMDGRYTLQARLQADSAAFKVVEIPAVEPFAWLAAAVARGPRSAFAPWLHRAPFVERLRALAAEIGGEAVALADHRVNALWADRPPEPQGPFRLHLEALAGAGAASKRARKAAQVRAAGLDAFLLGGALLAAPERDWLDAYHARVARTLTPHLDADDAAWLARAAAPL